MTKYEGAEKCLGLA